MAIVDAGGEILGQAPVPIAIVSDKWAVLRGEVFTHELVEQNRTGTETGMSNQSSEFAIQPILSTNDIERLSSFYARLFGADEHMRVPGRKGPFFVTLRLGEASLGLVAHKRGADAAPGRITVAVFVENVDDLLPRVEPAGGKVLGPANDMPWGHRVAHITDPDGNSVNLTQQL